MVVLFICCYIVFKIKYSILAAILDAILDLEHVNDAKLANMLAFGTRLLNPEKKLDFYTIYMLP